MIAGLDARHEDLPEAVAAHAHGVAPAVPVVEIADHADAPRIGREHGERDARDALVHERMRAELLVELQVRAFAQQIEVELRQDRRKAIGVLDLDDAFAEADAQPIGPRRPRGPANNPAVVNSLQRLFGAIVADRGDLSRIGEEDAHDRNAVLDMRPEIAEWVGVAAFDHRGRFRGKRRHAAVSAPHRI